MIALVAGSVAFPGIVKEKFPEKSHVNPIVKNYLSDEKVAFMMDYFKTGFFSKSLE